MSETQGVTRIKDKNDPRMRALREQARTLPLQSKFTDSEVAEGQFFLGRTGYTPEQILKAMPGMLDLAAAGKLDLGTTADIASNIQTAMRIPAEQMDKVADVMTAAFTRNNVDIRMLGESMKYSAGVGRSYNQSLETITTATALLGGAGIQGSQAGTTMRAILSRIGTAPAMKKLGISTKDKDGNMRDLSLIFDDLYEKTKKLGSVQRGEIFTKIAGRNAVSGFMELMKAVEEGKFREMRASLDNSKGEARQVAATMLDNLKGDVTMLHAGLENISVELFEKNSPWLRELAKDLQHFLHGIADFLKSHPTLSKAIVILLAGFAAIATIAGTVMIASGRDAGSDDCDTVHACPDRDQITWRNRSFVESWQEHITHAWKRIPAHRTGFADKSDYCGHCRHRSGCLADLQILGTYNGIFLPHCLTNSANMVP